MAFTKEEWDNLKNANCGNCKHFTQGDKNSFCSNPSQYDEERKEYVYYSFSCHLHENKN